LWKNPQQSRVGIGTPKMPIKLGVEIIVPQHESPNMRKINAFGHSQHDWHQFGAAVAKQPRAHSLKSAANLDLA